MDGTTKEQDKIRHMTLFISLLLLLGSVGSYLLYQQFYQTELRVTFVSKKVLPEAKAEKKLPRTGSTNHSNRKNNAGSENTNGLQQDPLKQKASVNDTYLQRTIPKYSDPKIFRITIENELSN